MAQERIRPTETPVIPEGDVTTRLITPYSARMVASTFDGEFLTKPEKILIPERIEAFTTHIASVPPDSISFTNIETASVLSRDEYWRENDKPFAEQNKEWNGKTWEWIKAQVTDDALAKDDAKAAFLSLGLHVENDLKTGELQDEVEKFRKKYVGEKSDIKQFVSDLASGCRENGQINLVIFEKRLSAVSGLFNAFGESSAQIPAVIKDLTTSYALLSQPAEKKVALVPKLLPHLIVPLADAQRAYMKKKIEEDMILPSDRTVKATTSPNDTQQHGESITTTQTNDIDSTTREGSPMSSGDRSAPSEIAGRYKDSATVGSPNTGGDRTVSSGSGHDGNASTNTSSASSGTGQGETGGSSH